jgi:tRNA threonylcarbamoyladenosine biosynthesis protein TsaB
LEHLTASNDNSRMTGKLKSRLKEASIKPDEPIIFALDTSSKVTSMTIALGDKIIKLLSIPADEKRSERLWIDVRALLDEAGKTIEEVDLFGVCIGPGGFTSLRVGVSAIKGFAAATHKPIAGVTSLEAAAFSAKGANAVCAMINAYKGEVYSQLFKLDEEDTPVAVNAPLVSTSTKALERVTSLDAVTFVGDGAIESAQIIRELGGDRFRESDEAEKSRAGWRIDVASEPVADRIARLSYLKFVRGETDSSEGLQAFYVRPAEAEIKLSLGLLGSKIQKSLKAQ